MKKQHEEAQLEKLLKNLAEEACPDKKFGQMLQHKLKERFAEAHGKPSFFMRLVKFKLQFATALVLVLFTSTTIYAYESDAVTNGHILYPLKRTTEKVEGMFANSPEEKSDYYHKMAKRRMRELDNLEKRGAFDEETVAEAETMLTYAEKELESLPDEIKEPPIFLEAQPAIPPNEPMLDEMAAPQIMMGEPPKNKREIKKEEIMKTHEEFKKFKKKIEEKIENQNGEPGKKDKKEILKDRKEMSGTQTLETETPPGPKTPQQQIPQPVSGPNTKTPKLPKMEYGETSIIDAVPTGPSPQPTDPPKIPKYQLASPPPQPIKQPIDPMIPTI